MFKINKLRTCWIRLFRLWFLIMHVSCFLLSYHLKCQCLYLSVWTQQKQFWPDIVSSREKCFRAVAHCLYIKQKDEDKSANSPRFGTYHTGAEHGCRTQGGQHQALAERYPLPGWGYWSSRYNWNKTNWWVLGSFTLDLIFLKVLLF